MTAKHGRATEFFCSEASRCRGEAVFGTAEQTDYWVLLEFSAHWPRDVHQIPLVQSIRAHLENLQAVIPGVFRFLLIKRIRHRQQKPVLILAGNSKGKAFHRQIAFDDVQDILAWSPLEIVKCSSEFEQPLALVCTHGNHDKCCAKFGYPVCRRLAEEQTLEVWQCSHLGGDRFAANVLHLPDNVLYGHVLEEDCKRFSAALASKEIHIERYRGSCSYDPFIQAAEYFVRRETGILGILDLVVMSHSDIVQQQKECTAIFRCEKLSTSFEVRITRALTKEPRLTTCSAKSATSPVEYKLLGISSIYDT